jgi:hypothetical protein
MHYCIVHLHIFSTDFFLHVLMIFLCKVPDSFCLSLPSTFFVRMHYDFSVYLYLILKQELILPLFFVRPDRWGPCVRRQDGPVCQARLKIVCENWSSCGRVRPVAGSARPTLPVIAPSCLVPTVPAVPNPRGSGAPLPPPHPAPLPSPQQPPELHRRGHGRRAREGSRWKGRPPAGSGVSASPHTRRRSSARRPPPLFLARTPLHLGSHGSTAEHPCSIPWPWICCRPLQEEAAELDGAPPTLHSSTISGGAELREDDTGELVARRRNT